jgi:hypothetical protein
VMLFLVVIENFIAAFWNVDPYHEGALYPTAIGMAGGKAPFSEVSQQYGFINPLINSWFLRIFGNYLIVSRILSFVIILLLSYLTFVILNKFIDRGHSKLICIVILAVSPTWAWPFNVLALSGGTWPNHYAIALTLVSSLLLMRFKLTNGSSFLVFFAGYLQFLSSQARMEFYFVWLSVTVSLSIYFWKYSAKKKGEFLVLWVSGSFAALLSTLLYLGVNGSLRDWIDQTVLVWFMDAPGVPRIGFTFLLFNSSWFVGTLLVALSVLALSYKLSKILKRKIFVLALVSCYLVLVPFLGNLLPKRSLHSVRIDEFLQVITNRVLFSYVNVLILTTILIIVALIFPNRLKAVLTSNFRWQEKRFELVLFGSISFGTLSLFHNFNPDYTGITVAPFLIFTAIFLSVNKRLNGPRFEHLVTSGKIALLAIVLVSSVFWTYHATQEKFQYKTKMLSGMVSNSSQRQIALDADLAMVGKYVTPGILVMNCYTGLLSVGSQDFLGKDQWTWNQQPPQMLAGRLDALDSGDVVLACNLTSADSEKINSLTEAGKIYELDATSRMTLYKVK